jgi:hypothetical protein
MNGETRRREILTGVVLAIAGMSCYIPAMTRAGANAGILDAFTSQGLLGGISATLLLAGVGLWCQGSWAALDHLAEESGSSDKHLK